MTFQVREIFEQFRRRFCSFKVAQSRIPVGIQAENKVLLMSFPVEHGECSVHYASLLVSKKRPISLRR